MRTNENKWHYSTVNLPSTDIVEHRRQCLFTLLHLSFAHLFSFSTATFHLVLVANEYLWQFTEAVDVPPFYAVTPFGRLIEKSTLVAIFQLNASIYWLTAHRICSGKTLRLPRQLLLLKRKCTNEKLLTRNINAEAKLFKLFQLSCRRVLANGAGAMCHKGATNWILYDHYQRPLLLHC